MVHNMVITILILRCRGWVKVYCWWGALDGGWGALRSACSGWGSSALSQRGGSCDPSRQGCERVLERSDPGLDGESRPLEMSPRYMFEKLEGIRVSLVQDNGTREASFVVEQMDGVQSTMFARLGLDRYIIK